MSLSGIRKVVEMYVCHSVHEQRFHNNNNNNNDDDDDDDGF
jgi:hypothetical protein